jgi:hypothetical protein
MASADLPEAAAIFNAARHRLNRDFLFKDPDQREFIAWEQNTRKEGPF